MDGFQESSTKRSPGKPSLARFRLGCVLATLLPVGGTRRSPLSEAAKLGPSACLSCEQGLSLLSHSLDPGTLLVKTDHGPALSSAQPLKTEVHAQCLPKQYQKKKKKRVLTSTSLESRVTQKDCV